MNDINNAFGKGSVTRLGSAGGALVYVLFFHVNSVCLCFFSPLFGNSEYVVIVLIVQCISLLPLPFLLP